MFIIVSKVFSILLAVIAISKSYVDFRTRMESIQMFVFWVLTWTAIVLVALYPAIIDFFLSYSRAGLGTFFGMGLVFLLFVAYRLYVKLERVEQKLTKTIQELALRQERMDSRHR